MIEALLLDFDGLMVDTETTDYESWRSVFEDHEVELPRDRWIASIGTDGSSFVPLEHLRELVGRIDDDHVQAMRRARREALFDSLAPLPGIVDWLTDARTAGVSIGVVSSSPLVWVKEHLDRVDLRSQIDFLMTRDEVPRVKPHPDLYVRALEHAGVDAATPSARTRISHGVARSAGEAL